MMVMAPPLLASYITMFVMLDKSLMDLLLPWKIRFNFMWCAGNEIIVVVSRAINK